MQLVLNRRQLSHYFNLKYLEGHDAAFMLDMTYLLIRSNLFVELVFVSKILGLNIILTFIECI
jgi:hypothetical protein